MKRDVRGLSTQLFFYSLSFVSPAAFAPDSQVAPEPPPIERRVVPFDCTGGMAILSRGSRFHGQQLEALGKNFPPGTSVSLRHGREFLHGKIEGVTISTSGTEPRLVIRDDRGNRQVLDPARIRFDQVFARIPGVKKINPLVQQPFTNAVTDWKYDQQIQLEYTFNGKVETAKGRFRGVVLSAQDGVTPRFAIEQSDGTILKIAPDLILYNTIVNLPGAGKPKANLENEAVAKKILGAGYRPPSKITSPTSPKEFGEAADRLQRETEAVLIAYRKKEVSLEEALAFLNQPERTRATGISDPAPKAFPLESLDVRDINAMREKMAADAIHLDARSSFETPTYYAAFDHLGRPAKPSEGLPPGDFRLKPLDEERLRLTAEQRFRATQALRRKANRNPFMADQTREIVGEDPATAASTNRIDELDVYIRLVQCLGPSLVPEQVQKRYPIRAAVNPNGLRFLQEPATPLN